MSIPPAYSVVIPARNAEGMIGEQLEALERQDVAEAFEVIVVLNGCTDDTEAEAAGFAERLNLRIVHSEPGYSSSRNAGAMAARTSVVLFCDADDAVHSDWVRTLGGAIRDRQGIVGGFFGYRHFNSAALCAVYGIDPSSPDGREAELGPDDFADRRSVAGANFGVWRADMLRVGGLDNSYHGGLEETDFCYRARRLGVPVTFCREARVEYRLRSTGPRAFTQQRGYALNKILFMVRTQEPLAGAVHSLPYSFDLSLKWSLVQLAKTALRILRYPTLSSTDRISALHDLGGHYGSVLGHVRYRVLHRIPPRELLTTQSPSPA